MEASHQSFLHLIVTLMLSCQADAGHISSRSPAVMEHGCKYKYAPVMLEQHF